MNARRLGKLGVGALLFAAVAGCNRNNSQAQPAASPSATAVAGSSTAAAAVPTVASSLPAVPAPFASPPVLAGTADVATLVARVKPTVVNITTEHDVKVPHVDFDTPFGQDMPEPFGGMFGRREQGKPHPEDDTMRQRAAGSGFLIDSAGHVVTNAHVVDDADTVRVKLSDDREFSAKVKGKDEKLDVALLEIQNPPQDLPAASLGSSEALRVGDYVVAIGNPFGLGHTVTMGIVSAKSRTIGAGPYDDFIQTDASINPGNSGGPLFNLRGEVVGINTAINPAGKGIGFAIPVDALREVLPQLLSTGHVERGRLGVLIQPVDAPLAKALDLDRPHGALVAEVEPGSPGEKAGLSAGDVILSVDGVDVLSSRDLPRIVARHAPGSKVTLRVQHRNAQRSVDVVLDSLDQKERGAQASPAKATPPTDLGVELRDARGGGAVVERVRPHSAASDQLEPGDVILSVNQAKVASAKEAADRIARAPKSAPILLEIKHGDHTRFVAIDRSAAP
jgi:serine protease Do